MATPVIDISNLRTAYGKTVVHDQLNLQVEQGELIALVGGSGSGKTTLLRQMLGLDSPSAGTVKVFGIDLQQADNAQLQRLRHRWGMLFQHGALFSALSTFDNVAQPMRELRTLPEDLIHDAVLLKLHMVGLTPADALKMPSDLSGGMVKRVALARALALEPELLFLDEPTAGLDPSLSDSFVALIASLREAMQLTVVMVTHDLDTLLALATRIAVLADKHLIAYGSAQEVIALPHPFIEQFFLGERGRRALQVLDKKQG
ncbi:ABC transporter ATP-binding protein [Actimicrobium sp. CCI2.3]|uniref:ABC transporter ATP-binding protein n=1 Tax=Actimicrobium sp. CCI2.3 TaxID=3048616 RepID=UPI002AB5B268|nr:ATP-binding cassette domain-containing protein [Actimicrobium sp. CCI2.3]MDY7576629.1 ATP-binding cassette domain-containing protein [Actimicrobium sp. CCI2.3]MEB0021230.1 ATP-binding cassette domain-containing protein [Actimicrobium sp. CCI2.3]